MKGCETVNLYYKKKRGGSFILKFIMCAAALVIIGGCALYLKDEAAFRSLREEVVTEKEDKEEGSGDGFTVNWDKIGNKDAIAWIRFKSIKEISYPVMQAKDNAYYLHRNTKKEYSFAGSIFMDYHNSRDFSDQNTIIYGHNMANGSMFGNLKELMDASFYEKHPFFYIYTRDGRVLKYRIFSASVVNPVSDIYTYAFGSLEKYQEYLSTWIGNSLYDTGERPSVSDHIVTLSTCTQHGSKRFAVQGYLVKVTEQK